MAQVPEPGSFNWKDRVRYEIDGVLAGGPGIQLAGLSALIAVAFLLGGLAFGLMDAEGVSREGAFWFAFTRIIDTGTFAGDQGFWIRVVSTTMTLLGLLALGVLISIVSNQSEARLADLRKGHGPVVEKNFFLILGWSPLVHTVIHELAVAEADAGRGRLTVVVMSPVPAERMNDDINKRLRDRRGSQAPGQTPVFSGPSPRVVCRTGNPIDLSDLRRMGYERARGIVVLRDEDDAGSAEMADVRTIRTLLGLKRGDLTGKVPVAAEIDGEHQYELAKNILADSPNMQVVRSSRVVSRLMAQAARQPGLYYLLEDILEFEGDEIYLLSQKGQPKDVAFADAYRYFKQAVPIGIEAEDRTVVLNPPGDRVLGANERLVILAADSTVGPVADPLPCQFGPAHPPRPDPERRKPEAHLVLGYNSSLVRLLQDLDTLAITGSTVTILALDPDGSRRRDVESRSNVAHIRLEFVNADPTDRSRLESAMPGQFNSIVVLADDRGTVEQADARTITTLLFLRDLERDGQRFPITTEILDERNKELMDVARVDDVIVTHRIASLMLAQLALEPDLKNVYHHLFHAGHTNLFLKPIDWYLEPGSHAFGEMILAAQTRGEIAIGYRIHAERSSPEQGFGIHVNPDRDLNVALEPEDRVIVLANQDG